MGGPFFPRRLSVQSLVRAVSVIAWLVCPVACQKGREGLPDIRQADAEVSIGIAGTYAEGQWSALRLRLTNHGADFHGSIEIVGRVISNRGIEPGTASYRLESVELSAQTTKEWNIPVRPQMWVGCEVRLRQPGYQASFPIEFPGPVSNFQVLAVSREGTDFSPLGRWLSETYAEQLDFMASNSPRNAGMPRLGSVETLRINACRPEELSTVATSYHSFGVVVLHRVRPRDLGLEVIEALGAYVESGGVVLVFPGPGWDAGIPVALGDLLRVDATARGTRPDDLLGSVFADLSLVDRLYYRAFVPTTDAESVGDGLAVRRTLGLGEVRTFSLSVGGPVFPGESEAPGIYQQLAGAFGRSLAYPGIARESLGRLDGVLPVFLYKMAGFSIPSRGVIVLSLGLYLAVGFLIPAYLFNRLRRREWTFAAVVLTAIVATVAIFCFGIINARDAVELKEISIVRVHDSGRDGEVTSYLGLIAPRLARLGLTDARDGKDDEDGPPESALACVLSPSSPQLYRQSSGPAPKSVVSVAENGTIRLEPTLMQAGEMRHFRHDYRLGLEDLVVIREEERPGTLRVTNESDTTWKTYVVRGRNVYQSGELLSGETRRIALDELSSEVAFNPSNWNPWSFMSMERASQAILQTLVYPRFYFDLTQHHPLEKTRLLDERFIENQPSLLVVVQDSGVFPAGRSIEKRDGQTIFIIEFPAVDRP